jgi:hypothetical protein
MPQRLLAIANLSFGRALLAALTLGRMDYLNADIDWVEGLLVNHHQIPADALDGYLVAYYEASHRHLDERGFVVLEWLSRLLGRPLPVRYQQMHKEISKSAQRQA